MVFRYKWVKNEQVCLYCSLNMLVKRNKKCIDGFEWRCMNYRCLHYQEPRSLKSESWLESFSTKVKTIMKAVYYHPHGDRQVKIIEPSEVGKRLIIKLQKIIKESISSLREKSH